MMQARVIGVLGGMGPEATVLLQQKLIHAVPATDDSTHIPLIVDMNTQVPSRIAHLLDGTGADPAPVLSKMARRLQVAGVAALAMPCNTAHYFADAITQAVDVPLLNMIDLAVAHAVQAVGQGGKVGLLASPVVRKIRLFETALEPYGISVVWPKTDAEMLSAIRMIKADGPSATARDLMTATSRELAGAGADLQIIACSELSLIADSIAPDVPAVDTLDLLVDAIVSFSFAE